MALEEGNNASMSTSMNSSTYVINKYSRPKPLQTTKKGEPALTDGEKSFIEQVHKLKREKLQSTAKLNQSKVKAGLKGGKFTHSQVRERFAKLRRLSSDHSF